MDLDLKPINGADSTECLPLPGNRKWVEKVWGGELILVNNELYCAKFLFVRPGWQCSLHRHLVKDETFVVRDGVASLEVNAKLVELERDEQQRIKPGTWHRFANKGQTLLVIMEVSTHHDDQDVERFEDSRKI